MEPLKNDAPPPVQLIENPIPPMSASGGMLQKPAASEPEGKLSDADRALFAQRGSELLAVGDIASARLSLERAAKAGDAVSAFAMAKTFDPVELTKAGVRGIKGDPEKADYWYRRARSLAGIEMPGTK
jgi:TPR repeat protein